MLCDNDRSIAFILCLLVITLIPRSGWAQNVAGLVIIDTFSSSNPAILAESFVGKGLVISNTSIDCAPGGFGKFVGTNSSIGMDSGIILTTGAAQLATGPNDFDGVTWINAWPGDNDLDSLVPGITTFDRCVLEFDLVSLSDTLEFNYVFASEEYPEYVGSQYNDIFGFFISGPGIQGMQNIALIPNTSTPVAINTVNDNSNTNYFVNNGTGFTSPQDTDPYYVQYDGYTVRLTARAVVQPCSTYHLKLAIADAGDQVLDSGVFLEANSLNSYDATVNAGSVGGPDYPYTVEGCNDGVFTFQLKHSSAHSTTLHFDLAGTADHGVDYHSIPDSIIIPPGQKKVDLTVPILPDTLTEGQETIVLYLKNQCFPFPIDSAIIYIFDSLTIQVVPDTAICQGDSIALGVTGALDYVWSPAISIDNPNSPTPIVYPQNPTTYIVQGGLGTCSAFDTVEVSIIAPPSASTIGDTGICMGDSIQLWADGGHQYSWSPPFGLSDPNVQEPISSPVYSILYTVSVLDTITGCKAMDSTLVKVNALPKVITPSDTVLCEYDSIYLSAQGGIAFSWQPHQHISDTLSPNPLVYPNETTTYTVQVRDANGCEQWDSIQVVIDSFPVVLAGPDTTIYLGNTVELNGQVSGSEYYWQPTIYLNDPTSLTPSSTPEASVTYYLIGKSIFGCTAVDSAVLVVLNDAPVAVPNAFTPNGDGLNDVLFVIGNPNTEVRYFRIYNRWGELIYETVSQAIISSSKNPVLGWDGQYRGAPQESGVYTYVFSGKSTDDQEIFLSGNVTLLR